MLQRKSRALSIALIFLLLLSQISYADSVFVAAAPNSNNYGYNGVAGSNVVSSQASAYGSSGQTIYPGSIGNVNDAPKTNIITSPAANNAKKQDSGNANIISNGYTWTTDTNNQAPVSFDISSPAAHQAQMRNGGVTTVIGENAIGNMTYNPPGDNGYDSRSGGNELGYGGNGVNFAAGGFAVKNVGIADPVINSDGAIVVNAMTREIYYAKNPNKAYPPAGLTTLLTGYLLLQYKQLTDVMAVTASAVTGLESGANTVGLKAGDTITVLDALYALYIKSACDVANVIAENVAGSQQAFVNLMNQTAVSWGTTSTQFANCNGLNNASQISSVYDMAIIMSNVIQNPTLNQIMQTPSYTLPATAHRKALNITTKNEFITPGKSNYYPGIISSRMGYTSKAKYTMASFAIHNNQYLIAIVMYSNKTQYVDSKRLLNFGKTAVDALGLTQATQMNYSQTAHNVTSSNINTASTGNVATTASSGDTPGEWRKDSKGWTFIKSNGSKATNEWIQTSGKKYCVDSSGYMITSWREFSNGNIYYFKTETGELLTNTWINTSNGAYYLQEDGSLARAQKGQTKTIATQVGNYVIDENGKALQKVNA